MSNLDALLNRKANTRDVELPDAGITVKVRGLTRSEALKVQGIEMDVIEAEVVLIAQAMVDPAMTEDQVRAWQNVSPAGELQLITTAVLELSRMTSSAPKETMRSFRG